MGAGENKKGRRLKGAVLFTVLAVMLVMLVLMITTLTLAGIASKKAYAQFYDTQTLNTARSVVDSVIASMQKDGVNEDLGQEIVSRIRDGGTETITNIKMNGLDAYGHIDSIDFSYVGKDEESGYYVSGTGESIIRVRATVTMGDQTSTYSQYVVGNYENDNNSVQNPNGFIVLGENKGQDSTNPKVTSPSYMFINEDLSYNNIMYMKNEAAFTSLVVNASQYANSNTVFSLGKNISDPTNPNLYNGVTIMGNLGMQNGITVNSSFAADKDTAKENIPYFYVGGTAYFRGSTLGAVDHPVNVYCGRIILNGQGAGANIYGDVYCYNTGSDGIELDPVSGQITPKIFSFEWNDTLGKNISNMNEAEADAYAKKSWSYIGVDGTSRLIDWVSGTKNGKTGNVFTRGSLALCKTVTINGDVYVGQDLYVDGGVNAVINGNIYVKGNVTCNKPELDGKIYKLQGSEYVNKADETNKISASSVPSSIKDFESKYTRDEIEEKIILTPEKMKNQFYSNSHFKGAQNISNVPVSANDAVSPTPMLFYKGLGSDGSMAKSTDGENWINWPDPTNFPERKSISDVEYNDPYTAGVKKKLKGTSAQTYALVIKESCTLMGSFGKGIIYIDPTATTTWINLYNVELSNDTMIIVNDDDGKKKVNFYLPSGLDNYSGSQAADYTITPTKSDKYETAVAGYIGAGKYKNELNLKTCKYFGSLRYYLYYIGEEGKTLELKSNPTGDDKWQATGINIYSREPKLDTNNKPINDIFINIGNSSCVFTGDIIAPSADFKQAGSGGSEFSDGVKYDGEPKGKKIAFIGSLIVGGVEELQNDYPMYFTSNASGGGPSISTGDIYSWTPIPGYADF